MRILMTGATGFIGRELGKALVARGDTLVCLVRDLRTRARRLPFPADVPRLGSHTARCRAAALHGVDAVLNLAGEPVADTRWTPAKKALIRDSRVQGTQQTRARGAAARPGPEHICAGLGQRVLRRTG
jgi:NAD dependent epimerase/dehydratase family enzyme